VVDDHPIVRRGVRAMLRGVDGIEWVGEAEDGPHAIRAVEQLAPDVVLMDLSLPGPDGSWATGSIVRGHPEVRVLVLTSLTDPDRLAAAVAAGAVGIVGKDGDAQALIDRIRAVVAT
jgi:DNA-binding NarL/FixJ family response regulator